MFIKCEQLLKGNSFAERASYIIKRPISLFYQMTLIADDTDNTAEVIRCATLVLKESKYEHSILAPYIQAFNRPGYSTTASEVYTLLGKIYDLRNTRDKLTILQGAKAAGNADLVQIVLESFTKDELDLITRAQ